MCGSHGSTVSSTSGPPQQFLQAYTDVYNMARGLTGQPYQSYTGPMVAGFSPDQLSAFGTIQGLQGFAQPYYNQAASYFNTSAMPITPMSFGSIDPGSLADYGLGYFGFAGDMAAQAAQPIDLMDYDISPYLSAYTSDVTNALSDLYAQNNAEQFNSAAGNAAAQGAYGSDREAILAAEMAKQQKLAQDPTLAQVQQQGFTTAQEEFNKQQAADLQRQLAERQYALGAGQLGLGVGQGMWGEFNTQQAQNTQAQEATAYLQQAAGYGMAGLGTQAQNAALQEAQAQLGIGGMEQGLSQQLLNVPYYQFMAQQAYPYQQLGWLSNIATGLGGASGGTSSTTYPGPSMFNQLAGLGTAGLGIYGLGNQQGWWGGSSTNLDPYSSPLLSDEAYIANNVFGMPYAADGGRMERASGGPVGLAGGGVPSEFGGSGVPGGSADAFSYIPGAHGLGSTPANPNGGGLNKMFMQPVTTQTQSGGGGGGLGSILGLGIKAAGMFLRDGGEVEGFAEGGVPAHAAAPIVADLSHVAPPSAHGPVSATDIMPAFNYSPTFDAQGHPGPMTMTPAGAPTPPPLSIPMTNGIFNRAALGPPPVMSTPVPDLGAAPTIPSSSNIGVPPIDMGANLPGGGASGGRAGPGGIGYDEGGAVPIAPTHSLADTLEQQIKRLGLDRPPGAASAAGEMGRSTFSDLAKRPGATLRDYGGAVGYPGYVPAGPFGGQQQGMGIPKPPTMPGWKPDAGLNTQSVLDMLREAKGVLSGLGEKSLGGSVEPSSAGLGYAPGGAVAANQMQGALLSQYQSMPIERLRDMAMRYPANSPQGMAIQRALQMKQMMQVGNTGALGPMGPEGTTYPGTAAARGGAMGLASGGDPQELDEDYGSPGWYMRQLEGTRPKPGGTTDPTLPKYTLRVDMQSKYPSPTTMDVLRAHELEGMTPVERSIKFAPSYGEGETIYRTTPAFDAASDAELLANLERQSSGGREDELLRALSRVQQYEEPTYPRVMGMGDVVNWPNASYGEGGGIKDDDWIEPPPRDWKPGSPPGLALGGDPVAEAILPPPVSDGSDLIEPSAGLVPLTKDDLSLGLGAPPEPKKTVERSPLPPAAANASLTPPPTETSSTDAGGVTTNVRDTGLGAAPSAAPAEAPAAAPMGTLMDIITSGEARSYNSANRGRAGDTPEGTYNLTGMTVADVMKAQNNGLFAAGKPQVIPSTMKFLVDNGYLSPNEMYNEEAQKKAFSALIGDKKRPAAFAYITGKSDDLAAATHAVGQEWTAATRYPDAVSAGLQGARKVYQDAIKDGASHQDAWNKAMTTPVGAVPVRGKGLSSPDSVVAGGSGDKTGKFTEVSGGSATPQSIATGTSSADLMKAVSKILSEVEDKSTGQNIASSPWMGLIAAGLGMMASRSPYPGVAIGEGGLQGLKMLQESQAQGPKNEVERLKALNERLKLQMMPVQMQAGIDTAQALVGSPAAGGAAPPVGATSTSATAPASAAVAPTKASATTSPEAGGESSGSSENPMAPAQAAVGNVGSMSAQGASPEQIAQASLKAAQSLPIPTPSKDPILAEWDRNLAAAKMQIARMAPFMPEKLPAMIENYQKLFMSDPRNKALAAKMEAEARIPAHVMQKYGESQAELPAKKAFAEFETDQHLLRKKGETEYELQDYTVQLPGNAGEMTLLAPRSKVIAGTAPGLSGNPITPQMMVPGAPQGQPAVVTPGGRYDPSPESIIPVGPPPGATAKGPINLSASAKGKLEEDYKNFQKMSEASNSVPLQMERINRLNELLDKTSTGKLAEAGYELAAWAQSIGFGGLIPPGYKPAQIEEINKLATQLVYAQIKQIGGRALVAEIDGLSRSNPHPGLTPQANKAILANLALEQQLAADKYHNATQVWNRYKQLGDFEDKYIQNTPAHEFEENIRRILAPEFEKAKAAAAARMTPPSGYPNARYKDGIWYVPLPDGKWDRLVKVPQ